MPRLPDSSAFGPRPVPVNRQGVAQQDTTSAGESMARLGQVIAQAGETYQKMQQDRQRAFAGMRMAESNNKAREAGDEIDRGIQDGVVDVSKANELAAERLNKIREEARDGLSQEQWEHIAPSLEVTFGAVRRGVLESAIKKGRQDVASTIDRFGEQKQREAVRIGPAAASESYDAFLDFNAGAAGLSPDKVQAAKQKFKEGAYFTSAYSLVNEARRDNKALDQVDARLKSDEYSPIDPQRKAQLLTTIEGYRVANTQRAEAEARRREADEDRRIRRAQAQFDAAQSIITTGRVLSQEYVDQVSAAVSGTPYELAFREALKVGPERAAFGAQPLAVMDRALVEARARLNANGTDPTAEKRVRELETIRDAKRRGMREDPLIASQEYGGPPVPEIDTTSVTGLLQTVGRRADAVAYANQQSGAAVSPLLSAEAAQVSRLLSTMPVEQRSSAIAQIAQSVGPQQAAALGRQIAEKDKPTAIAFGMAGDRTTAGRYASELVLKGAQAIKDKAVKDDNAVFTGVRARIAAELGDAYPNPEVRQAIVDAAVYAEYGLQSEGSGDINRAVRLVTGGLTERGGRKVPLPRGMSPEEFGKRIETLSVGNLKTPLPGGKVYAGQASLSLEDFLKQVPDAALIQAGQGRYAVQAGGAVATNAEGAPLIFEVN